MTPRSNSAYDERSAQAELMARKRAAERDIEIPEVVNPKRKKACELDLLLYSKTYFGQAPDEERFPGLKGWCRREFSPRHIEILKEFELRILYGGQKALAAPRGFGKDTLAEIAAMWAASYGHSRFTVFTCFEQTQAEKRIGEIKDQFEINKWLMEDFPEICAPIRALNRAAQRAKQQTCGGEFTRIEWGNHIVMPAIRGSKASGCIIAPGSLSGSVRGMRINGQRPTFVIVSDPQTEEVARSKTQVDVVLDKIQGDFGGLGAVDESLAFLGLMTLIRRNDVASRMTDVKQYPQWAGMRFGSIIKWPDRMDLWDQYEGLMEADMQVGDVSARGANAFYLANRKDMDAGSEVSWEDAYVRSKAADGTQLETSALQHYMNIRWRFGHESFMTEYQNEPPINEGIMALEPSLVAGRLSQFPNTVIPPGYEKLVQFIDVGAREIHFVVMALKKTDTETAYTVIDYGIVKTDAPEGDLSAGNKAIQPALERAILVALKKRRTECMAAFSRYKTVDGRILEPSLTIVDSGWLENVVYFFCKESGPRWIPSKGHQAKKGSGRYSPPQKRGQGIKIGNNWHCKKLPNGTWLYHLNADHWKLFAHERFGQSPDTDGAVTVFGIDPREHRTYSKHICAEEWDMETSSFIEKSRWNHYLDCTAGCFAGAEMLGVRILPIVERNGGASSEYQQRWKEHCKKKRSAA
jgi:hypothetical protein